MKPEQLQIVTSVVRGRDVCCQLDLEKPLFYVADICL